MERTIGIVIADDEETIATAVRSLSQSVPCATAIAEAVRGEHAVALVSAISARRGVDGHFTGVNGLDATRQIRREAPAVKVIILTAHADHNYLDRALEDRIPSRKYQS